MKAPIPTPAEIYRRAHAGKLMVVQPRADRPGSACFLSLRVWVHVVLRVNPAETDSLVREPHVGRFVMRGREMDGWLRVDPPAFDTDEQLDRWLRIGVDYARSLPPK